jgi:hypothetical protein
MMMMLGFFLSVCDFARESPRDFSGTAGRGRPDDDQMISQPHL